MAVFSFKARDVNQRVIRGRIKAATKEDVEQRLMARQLTLISASEDSGSSNLLEMSFGGVKSKNLVVATRQLAFLVNASVPIVQALEAVSVNTDDHKLKSIFKKLSVNVESGQSFSNALKSYPHIFNELYLSMVKAGEEGGTLDSVLKQLSTYIEKSENIKQKVKSALMYPCFITVAAFAILTAIIVFLVPKFEEIFSDAGQELPELTQLIISISHFIRNHYVICILGIIAVIVCVKMILKTDTGARNFERLLLNLPGFGPLFSKNYVANYSRTLSSLLSSGVMVIDGIKISGKASGSILIKEASYRMCKIIEAGHNFGKALTREKIFPGLVKNMVIVGEETGNVDAVLEKIADFYEEQVEVAVEGLLKLIEPAMILGVALVIGFILIALYLPIFEISGTMAGG